jgi:hypothetical protein
MTGNNPRRIGILVGQETDWPEAFLAAVNGKQNDVIAELVQLGGTFLNKECPYNVIIDRISNEVPYYRAYLKHAAVQGCYVINNPFVWSADSKFYGLALAQQMGLPTPRTVALPNKYIRLGDAGPDAFRNLVYPMDWGGIIAYVGVPAVFKDINSGGQHLFHLVNDVDELIQRYDESGTHSMILQQYLESARHVHCLVIDQKAVLPLHFDRENGRYQPHLDHIPETLQTQLQQHALALTQAYQYDINLVEFVLQGDLPYVTNCTNAAPIINRSLMSAAQFDWSIQQMASLALDRALNPIRQKSLRDF